MDRISQLLDDQTVSLDEVLAFIDASDFDLAGNDGQGEQVGDSTFTDPLDIEDALMQTSGMREETRGTAAVTNPQQCDTLIVSAPQTHASDHNTCLSREQVSAAPCRLKLSVEPYKEHGRVRERAIRLRGMVTQLERHLEELSALKTRDGGSAQNDESEAGAVNAEPGVAQDSDDIITWRQLAVRQYAARRAAEKENLSLKEHLEEQIRLAKRLERLIRGQL
jgi:hypothetical protein